MCWFEIIEEKKPAKMTTCIKQNIEKKTYKPHYLHMYKRGKFSTYRNNKKKCALKHKKIYVSNSIIF